MKALYAILLLFPIATFSQLKVYMFNDVQRRDEKQQWSAYLNTDEDCVAYIDEHTIYANIDQLYHLSIVSTTHLPSGGVVYLCKDDAQHDVTVTLIGDDRMFFYSDDKRFMISFSQPVPPTPATASIANTED